MPAYVDGNALAGPLSEVFRFDITRASGRCLGCGDVSVVAAAQVYETAMGSVVRCRACGSVLMTVVERADRTWIDLHGVTGLHVSA
jgi:hypothetical protein